MALTKAEERKYNKWVASRPANVRKVAERFDPSRCYRSKNDTGHYGLCSFEENEDGTVTLKIVHGGDSYFPGTIVFGVNPDSLVLCDCGKWKPATQEDLGKTRIKIDLAILSQQLESAFRN